MNNNLKKLLSVILCAVLLFTTASTAFAAEETKTEISTEETETETAVTEKVTENVSEETLFEKLKNKIDDFWYHNAPYFYFGTYFTLVGLIGSVASVFTWPISLILILTGNAGW